MQVMLDKDDLYYFCFMAILGVDSEISIVISKKQLILWSN